MKDEKESRYTIEELKGRIKRAKEIDGETHQRIRDDLAAALGQVDRRWTKKQKANFGESRANLSIPLVSAQIKQAVSRYSASPFSISISAVSQDAEQKAELLESVILGIESRSGSKNVYRSVFESAAACGYAYLHPYTIKRDDDLNEIRIQGIDNPLAVVVDPSSVKSTAEDAEFIAFIDRISKDKAKRLFGEEIDLSKDASIEMTESLSEDETSLTTIYIRNKETEKFDCYRIVGDKIVEVIPTMISKPPIIRVAGERLWDETKLRWVYCGLGHQVRDLQTLANFAASQMAERLTFAPKANFIAPTAAISGVEQHWANSNKSIYSILGYKHIDEQGNPIPMPQQVITAVEVGDVANVVSMAAGLISDTIGSSLQSMGREQTAEEALIREGTAEGNSSYLYESLADSIKALGAVLLEMISINYDTPRKVFVSKEGEKSWQEFGANRDGILPNEFEATVDAGPLMSSQRKGNARALLSLMDRAPMYLSAILPSAIKNIDLTDKEELLERIAAQDAVGQMGDMQTIKSENEELKMLLSDAKIELARLNSSVDKTMITSQTTIAKEQMATERAMQLEMIRQQGDAQKTAEQLASKESIESDKIALQLEKLAMEAKLEAAKALDLDSLIDPDDLDYEEYPSDYDVYNDGELIDN